MEEAGSGTARSRDHHPAAFIRAFFAFGGSTMGPAALLVVAGSLLEGFGLVLLVPVLTLLMPGSSTVGPTGHRLDGLIRIVPAGWLLPLVLVAFCAILALRSVVLIQRDWRVDRLAFGFADAQRHRVIAALTRASWPELATLRHSQITHVLSGEVGQVSTAAHLLPQIAVAAIMIGVQGIVLAIVSPMLAVVSLGLTGLGVVALARAARSSAQIGAAGVQAGFRIADQIAALLGGLKFAAVHGLRTALADRAAADARALTGHILQQRRRYSRASVFMSSGAAVIGVLLVAIGTLLGVSTVALLAGLAILLRMSGPLRVLQSNVPQFAAMMPAFSAVTAMCETLERTPEPTEGIETVDEVPGTLRGRIEARGLRLTHPGDRTPIFDGADFAIAPGEFVGVAGSSGAGKTTLLDIVAGLRSPDSGAVSVGGIVLDPAGFRRWRHELAYVTQDTYLFDDSLRLNLLWGSARADDGMLWTALDATGLADMVRSLPEGLDTRVGERGLRFSGGQRQRFALARAILRRPHLLLLDEATSALDLDAEATVLTGLRRTLPRAAMILVSHRPEALAACDRVVALIGGRLVDRH